MSNRLLSWTLFVLLCFIWGSSFILMRYSKESLNAYQIASLRICSAGLVFLPFAIFHLKQIPSRKILPVLFAGILGNLLPAFLFAIAIGKNIDSSLAGILNSLTPICVVLVGIIFFKDHIKAQKILGVMVGFAGLLLLTLSRSSIRFDNFGYALLILLGTICYGFNVNIVGHYLKTLKPIPVATVSLAFLTLPTSIILWQQGFFKLDFADSTIRWGVLASLVLGVLGSAIATAIFYLLVKLSGGLFASLVTYGIPFIAIFWGFIYGEKVTLLEILCLGVILLGVFLAQRK